MSLQEAPGRLEDGLAEPPMGFSHRVPQQGLPGPPAGQAFSRTRGLHALGLGDGSASQKVVPALSPSLRVAWSSLFWLNSGQSWAGSPGRQHGWPLSPPVATHLPAQTPPSAPPPTGPHVLSNSGAPWPLLTACLRCSNKALDKWLRGRSGQGTPVSEWRPTSQTHPRLEDHSREGVGPAREPLTPRHSGVVSPRGDARQGPGINPGSP